MSHVVDGVYPPGSLVTFLSESKIVHVLLCFGFYVFFPSITQPPPFPQNITLPKLHIHYDINTS
jgi:hypothetical protein